MTDGLKALLRQIDRLARFTEAQDWRQIERTFKRHRPDLLAVDWQDWMTVADARELLSYYPDLRVAILTDNMSPATMRALMDEGVLGVIPRETDPSLIIRALEMVLLGGHYVPPGALALDPPLPPDTAIRLFDAKSPPPRRTRLSSGLSPRQEQIMRCVHMGSTNKMIARTLGISEGTVKIHLTSIFQQLGAPNRAAAVALYNGWLTNHFARSHRATAASSNASRDKGLASRCRAAATPQAAALPVSVARRRHERPDADGSRAQHALWRRAARHADEAGYTELNQCPSPRERTPQHALSGGVCVGWHGIRSHLFSSNE